MSVFLHLCKQSFHDSFLHLSLKHRSPLLAFFQSVLCRFDWLRIQIAPPWPAFLTSWQTSILLRSDSWLPGTFPSSSPPENTFLALFSVFSSLTPSYSLLWVTYHYLDALSEPTYHHEFRSPHKVNTAMHGHGTKMGETYAHRENGNCHTDMDRILRRRNPKDLVGRDCCQQQRSLPSTRSLDFRKDPHDLQGSTTDSQEETH